VKRGGWLILGAVAALLVVLVAPRFSGTAPEEKEEAPPPVPVRVVVARPGAVAEPVTVAGMLRAAPNAQARVGSPIAGRLLGVYARPGDRVRAGQVLAAVDAADLEADAQRARAAAEEAARQADAAQSDVASQRVTGAAQQKEAEAALRAAEARLQKATAGSRPQEIARAAATLRALEADLAKLRAGARPQEIGEAAATVREAQAELQVAQHSAERKRRLLDQGIVSAKDVERAEADLKQAEAREESSRQALELLRAGPRPEEIQAQEARVAEARSALELARAGSRPEEIAEARAAVGEARAKLAAARAARWQATTLERTREAAQSRARAARSAATQAEALLSRAQIRSPIDGVVSERLAEQGEVVSAGGLLLTVVRPEQLRVTAQVASRVADRLRAGLPATVRIGGSEAAATVAVVSAAAADTGLVPIELQLRDAPRVRQLGGREGMPVEIALRLPSRTQGLVLPSGAVFTRGGESLVYVVDHDQTVHERRVDLVGELGEQAEISTGLRPGERVVADGTLSLAEGTKVEPQP
jgi:RND family efflux transporter MFP subunit